MAEVVGMNGKPIPVKKHYRVVLNRFNPKTIIQGYEGTPEYIVVEAQGQMGMGNGCLAIVDNDNMKLAVPVNELFYAEEVTSE